MKSFAEIKKRLMKNKKFAETYKRNEPLADFIDEILLFRAKRGWTQKQLAEKIGTKVPNISRIESGKQNISFSMMQRISEALGGELLITMRKEDFVELSEESKKILKELSKSEQEDPKYIVEKSLKYYYDSLFSHPSIIATFPTSMPPVVIGNVENDKQKEETFGFAA